MKIELITIGSELLAGSSLNTNAAFIGKSLRRLGFNVSLQTVIADEEDIIKKTFEEALLRSNVILVTGGLGPTLDDITKQVAASLFNSGFIFSEEVKEEIESRFGRNNNTIQSQARVPEKAKILKNKVGTAPGFIFNDNQRFLILMPGVPREMETMMRDEVLPFLSEQFNEELKSTYQNLIFYRLKEAEVDPLLRQLNKEYKSLEFGIYPGLGKLQVEIKGALDAKEQLIKASERLKKEFESHFFDYSSDKVEEAIHKLFKDKNFFLSLAESCTGGRIASKLTLLDGASDFFLGSLVCYSNAFKKEYLAVSEDLLKSEGAVSSGCVIQMAESLLENERCDYSLAVSGIAGPTGGSPEKPVGTVFGAIGFKEGSKPFVKVIKLQLFGTRESIIETASNILLFELYKLVSSNLPAKN